MHTVAPGFALVGNRWLIRAPRRRLVSKALTRPVGHVPAGNAVEDLGEAPVVSDRGGNHEAVVGGQRFVGAA